MYNYILYLFGFNNEYYKEPEVIITSSAEVIQDKIRSVLENHKKNDMITQYELVITELKEKLKERELRLEKS